MRVLLRSDRDTLLLHYIEFSTRAVRIITHLVVCAPRSSFIRKMKY